MDARTPPRPLAPGCCGCRRLTCTRERFGARGHRHCAAHAGPRLRTRSEQARAGGRRIAQARAGQMLSRQARG